MKMFLFLFTAMLLQWNYCFAQQHHRDSVVLGDVTVIGKGKLQKLRESALSVNAIDVASKLNTIPNLNDVVNQSTGVKIRYEGGLGSDFELSLNGMSGNSVRYFIDGIPLETKGNEVTLANIPVNMIDHIEVFKGVVPAYLGQSHAVFTYLNAAPDADQRLGADQIAINEVFGERYTGKEQIEFLVNEHFLNRQGGEERKRVTDTCFRVLGEGGAKKYHIESQSLPDSSLLVRIFEYDTQIALDEGSIEGDLLTVTFPHSAVLFLRHTRTTPARMGIRMVTPGGDVSYEIPVMKVQAYGLRELFAKRLYFLLPFYIFSHESRFGQYEQDAAKLGLLQGEYAEIHRRLEELQESGIIDEFTRQAIIDMSKRVLQHIARRYQKVKEGVRDIMGGKILEYEAKTIRNESWNAGRAEGWNDGKEDLARALLASGAISVEAIQQATGWDRQQVEALRQP